MGKTFFASCLLLLLASGLVWSANAAATDVQASAEQTLELYGPAHGAVDAALPPPPTDPCTITCWDAPQVSCSSQTGNCYRGQGKGIYYIGCDGQFYLCPS